MSTLLGTLAIVDHIAPNVTEKEKDISDIRKKIQQEEALLQEMFEEFCERSESVNYLKKTRTLVVDLMRYVPADKSEEAYFPYVIWSSQESASRAYLGKASSERTLPRYTSR